MQADLLKRLRAQREELVDAGGLRWRLRRPTELQLAKLREADGATIVRTALVGWEGVREQDILAGGSDEIVDFDLELAVEYLSDHVETLVTLAERVVAMAREHVARTEEDEKN